MWRIEEHRQVDRELSSGRVPIEILKRYEKWKDIVMLSGPQGLRVIKGFRDESLHGEWKGFRSSRLNEQLRVIYQVVADTVLVRVMRVTPHDYRKN
jgi:addiction module RelE/StbE family toxin